MSLEKPHHTERPVQTAQRIQTLDSRTFDDFVALCRPFEGPRPLFDLATVQFVTPAAMVNLAAICSELAGLGRRVTVRLPALDVQSYLERAGFIEVLSQTVDFENRIPLGSFDALRGSNPLLIEVTPLHSGSLPELLDRIVIVLRERMRYAHRDAYDCAISVSEAAQNSLHHSGGASAFLAMQAYSGFLQIAIADCGIGLLESLRHNEANANISSDTAAVRAAVQLGVSSLNDPTHGTGLYHLLELAYEQQGAVQIRSGSAKARYRGDKRRGWLLSVPHVPGVQIELSLERRNRRG